MAMEIRVPMFLKAEVPMLVTVFGMTVLLQPECNSLELVMITALQSFRESYTGFPASTTICSKPSQPESALSPKEVTVFGMNNEVRPVQSANASDQMVFTEFGMVIAVRPLHSLNA